MRWFPLVCLGLFACDREPPPAVAPPPLAPRPIPQDRSCEQLAASTPGASWKELGPLRLGGLGLLAVLDPSVLRGPFEEPLRVPLREPPVVRVLRSGAGDDEAALCVQLRVGKAEQAPRRLLGHVGVDTGMLLLGDEALLAGHAASAAALVVPCAEAPADELTRLEALPTSKGEPFTRILPTLACLERPAIPEDRARISGALHEIRSEGRFLLEPRGPAWTALRALGAAAWGWFPEGATPVGLVIEVRSGDGAYPVLVEGAAEGSISLVEIPLR